MTKSEREQERSVLERLRADALILATAYRLPLRSVEAERPQVKRRYGICYDDGSIRIRLRHVRTGQLLKYSSLIDTLCHELAHLRHFDHGRRFYAFYEKVLGYARRRGVYRASPRSDRASPRFNRASPRPQYAAPLEEPRSSALAGLGPARSAPNAGTDRGEPVQLELFSARSLSARSLSARSLSARTRVSR